MAKSWARCFFCGKELLKDNRHINENRKFGYRIYCSLSCLGLARVNKIEFICENQKCKKKFRRQPSDISFYNYCSRSCAAIVNNKKYPRKTLVIRTCNYCGEKLFPYRKYCSVKCRSDALTISKESLFDRIRKFYQVHGRIPVKREMNGIYRPARKYCGSWNNAIIAAGFKPHPVMFADRCIANDGHSCDSIAEKLIDDYLFEKAISHERNISYPEGEYSADFKIGTKWIEYFGLAGEHKRYDELRVIKQKLARKYKLNLIELYPKDLYPQSKLEVILGY